MTRSRSRWLAVGAAAVLVAVLAPASAATAAAGGIIAGHVTDNGVPVAGVSVRLQATGPGAPTPPPTTTDSTGGFSFANVTPASYRVTYSLPGNAIFYANGAITFADADPITVVEGGSVQLDEAVPAHGSVHGQLVKANGTPQPNAQVRLQPGALGFPGAQATTDVNGNYTIPYVWVGSYKIGFQPPSGPQQYFRQQTDFTLAEAFTVAAGDSPTINETLLGTGNIVGRLTNQGAPVSFAFVSVLGSNGSIVGTGVTGIDGSYRIAAVAGTYAVQFRLPNGITQYAHQKTSLSTADRFTVVVDQDTVVDEQVFATSTVRGTLLRADGTPATFVQVVVGNPLGGSFVTTTGPVGVWQLQVLPGTYTVRFLVPGLGTQYAVGKTTASSADQIVVGEAQTIVVDDRLLAPATLNITARDKRTGAALSSFCASLSTTAGTACTTTGTATVTTMPGRYDASVSTSDQIYLTERVQGDLAAGETATVVVDLTKASTLTTVIKDAQTGAPVANACLQLIKPLEPVRLGIGGSCSGPDGVVTMRSLPAQLTNAFVDVRDGVHGSQWVGLTKGVGAQARARLILIEEGASVTLPDIKLDGTGSITGVVRNEAGQPVADAYVALGSVNAGFGPAGNFTVTDPQGRYTLSNLGPYAWTVFYKPLGSGNAAVFSGGTADRFLARGIKVTAGQTATFDQSVRAGTILTGVGHHGRRRTGGRLCPDHGHPRAQR